MHSVILEVVNEKRAELGIAEYETLEQLLDDWGIRVGHLDRAVRYLKEEEKVFVRNIWVEGDRVYGYDSLGFQRPIVDYLAKNAPILRTEDGRTPLGIPEGDVFYLDVLRSRLEGIIRTDNEVGVLTAKQRDLVKVQLDFINNWLGSERIVFTSEQGKIIASIYGVEEEKRFSFIFSEDGLKCALLGRLRGQPCDPQEEGYVIPVEDLGYDSYEGVRRYRLRLDEVSLSEEDIIYVFDPLGFGVINIGNLSAAVGSSDLNSLSSQPGHGIFLPGIIEKDGVSTGFSEDLGSIVSRNPYDLTEPLVDTLTGYFDRYDVPPLENEITDDSDRYEDSFRYYLEMAKREAEIAEPFKKSS
jgi:hypothetical protein